MKKYDKLQNRGFRAGVFQNTGLIVQEKLDGSNASFTYNAETLEFEAYSRRQRLGAKTNTLNGFLGWAEDFVKSSSSELIDFLKNHIIFGEWLVKHKVQYKESAYKEFYAFDIYNKNTEKYLSFDEYAQACSKFGLKIVKTFWIATSDFIKENTEDVDNEARTYVGSSVLTENGQHGEGIVIKSLKERDQRDACYKIVTNTFKEFSKRKMNNEKKSNESVADYAITRARMEKQIYKAIDEARLTREDIVIENFGKVIKEVGQNFVDDIFEEEMEQMKKIIEKQIKRKMPIVLREILMEDN